MARPSDPCPGCGLEYDDLKTGLTYRDIYQMLWTGSEDSSDWRYKRRGTVLGKWHQIKREMWDRHISRCCSPSYAEVPF